MEKRVCVYEAHRNLDKIINEVQFGKDVYIIERHKQPVVVMVSAEAYQAWNERRKLHDVLDEARSLQERILSRRQGKPIPSSSDTLSKLREART